MFVYICPIQDTLGYEFPWPDTRIEADRQYLALLVLTPEMCYTKASLRLEFFKILAWLFLHFMKCLTSAFLRFQEDWLWNSALSKRSVL